MLTRLLIIIVFVVVTPKVQSQTTSFRLSNGVPVTLNTIEQAKDIAMEAKQLGELVDRVVTIESQRVVRILPLDDLRTKATP